MVTPRRHAAMISMLMMLFTLSFSAFRAFSLMLPFTLPAISFADAFFFAFTSAMPYRHCLRHYAITIAYLLLS